MSDPIQHLPLAIRMFDLLHPHHPILCQDLDRVTPAVMPRSSQVDPSERSGPQGPDEGEIVQSVTRGRLSGQATPLTRTRTRLDGGRGSEEMLLRGWLGLLRGLKVLLTLRRLKRSR